MVVAYLDPSLVSQVVVVSRLGAAVDGLSLARGRDFVGRAERWSLPIFHLDQARWMRGNSGRCGNRHERQEPGDERSGCGLGRSLALTKETVGMMEKER